MAEATEVRPARETDRLFSPAGFVVLLVVMAASAAAGALVSSLFRSGGAPLPGTLMDREIAIVDLDTISRQVRSGDASDVRNEVFSVHVQVVLNPAFRDPAEVRRRVSQQRALLKDRANRKIWALPEDRLRAGSGVLDDLSVDLKRDFNETLGVTGDGHEIVHRVIFPESRLLPPLN